MKIIEKSNQNKKWKQKIHKFSLFLKNKNKFLKNKRKMKKKFKIITRSKKNPKVKRKRKIPKKTKKITNNLKIRWAKNWI